MAINENKRTVKDLFAAFGRGDIAGIRALVGEDVIWQLPGTVPHYSGTYKGPSNVANFFQKLNATLESKPSNLVNSWRRVIAFSSSVGPRGRVQSTGCMFDNRWVMAFTVRDGRITKFEEYADTQALADAYDVSSRPVRGTRST